MRSISSSAGRRWRWRAARAMRSTGSPSTSRARPCASGRNRSAWGGAAGAEPGPVTIELATRNLRSVRCIGRCADRRRWRARPRRRSRAGRQRAAARDRGRGRQSRARPARLGPARGGGQGAQRCAADFQGTGEVEASRLAANTATVTTNTVGSVALTVNGPATINANGLGTSTCSAGAVCDVNGPGADQVVCGGTLRSAPAPPACRPGRAAGRVSPSSSSPRSAGASAAAR